MSISGIVTFEVDPVMPVADLRQVELLSAE
jgi:hypothetical protein